MELIRIEYPENGLGVWRCIDKVGNMRLTNHSQFSTIMRRHSSSKFPTPLEDDELRIQINELSLNLSDYKFAFLTLQQLEEGFTRDELKELIEMGFKVYSIEAKEVIFSSYQAIFKNVISQRDISFMFL